MIHPETAKCWSTILVILMISTHILCVPSYLDYENARDLYEILLQKQIARESQNPEHQIARKSARSPSLRLRFGKKSEPYHSPIPILERFHTIDEGQKK